MMAACLQVHLTRERQQELPMVAARLLAATANRHRVQVMENTIQSHRLAKSRPVNWEVRRNWCRARMGMLMTPVAEQRQKGARARSRKE